MRLRGDESEGKFVFIAGSVVCAFKNADTIEPVDLAIVRSVSSCSSPVRVGKQTDS